ncbi:lithostathine-1-like [Branchiostoma floridae x Branchiostoma japonicum]
MDINECTSTPCQHGQCVNKDSGYKCTCSPGWTGQNCEQDINECTRKPCQHGQCVNKDGGYKCTCSPGWTGQNCQQDINECTRKPCQHGRCVNKDGGYKCTCSPGWTGHNCQARICQNGWREHSNHCYKLITDRVGWYSANSRCKNQRANLASIHSMAEMNFINSLITNAPQGDQPVVWFGLKRQHGGWTWSDGSRLFYSNWAPGEPNRKALLTLAAECAGIASKTGKQWFLGTYMKKGHWNDQRCEARFAYICKN